MTAYYNENDPKAAQWLRELIKAGHIASGDVDERSIEDVFSADVAGYTQCHFFAGIGGWSYALRLARWPDDRPVWTGSCPCQPFSAAGKGKGFADERHLWPAWKWLVEQCQPAVVFGEQVASPAGLAWFDAVSTDLEGQDYACAAADLCAAGIGAPHIRQRLYWVADTEGIETRRAKSKHSLPKSTQAWSDGIPQTGGCCSEHKRTRHTKPGVRLVADGVSANVDFLRGYGNAIVPQVAAAFIEAYLDCTVERVVN